MASDSAFVQYVCDQLARAGTVTSRKMFGEFALYLDEKVIILVCDNQVFLKPTDAGLAVLERPVYGAPYPGAKPYFQITDLLDDPELLVRLVRVTADALPAPKKKSTTKTSVKKTAVKKTAVKKTAVKKTSAKKTAKKTSARKR
ncbi:MAG: TfoX/Sxy family protein [Gemmatimonadaceae bacterium]|nr:TfoX/Sxy family protein [Gemmatimonadaceae bacterium]